MDHVAGSLHILLAEKRGEDLVSIICLKLYQFEITTWWCLSVLEFILEFALEFVMLKNVKKNHGLSKFTSRPPLGGRPAVNSGRPWNLIHSSPCRVFIHEVFFGPLGLHLSVWSELERSPTMRALRLQRSWAFSFVCEVALKYEAT